MDDGALPSCAPQVLAAPLHLRLLAHQSYPLPVLGMVHIRNVIDETQPVPASAALLLRAAVAGERHMPRGIEVDIVTEARTDADARPLWTSTMTALVRTASPGE